MHRLYIIAVLVGVDEPSVYAWKQQRGVKVAPIKKYSCSYRKVTDDERPAAYRYTTSVGITDQIARTKK